MIKLDQEDEKAFLNIIKNKARKFFLICLHCTILYVIGNLILFTLVPELKSGLYIMLFICLTILLATFTAKNWIKYNRYK